MGHTCKYETWPHCIWGAVLGISRRIRRIRMNYPCGVTSPSLHVVLVTLAEQGQENKIRMHIGFQLEVEFPSDTDDTKNPAQQDCNV